MSIADKFEKVYLKFKSDANYFELLDYFKEINLNLDGGGGVINASDVVTDDSSNVQAKLDEHENYIGTNTSDISGNALDIATNITNIANNTLAIADLEPAIISISDTSASVVVSTTENVTYLSLLLKNFGVNDSTYYSFSGSEFTFLKDGTYRISVVVNAEKSGGGNPANLLIRADINGSVPKNAFRILQIDNDGTISAGFSGITQLSANDVLKINFVDTGPGVITATSDAAHDAFILQVEKLA